MKIKDLGYLGIIYLGIRRSATLAEASSNNGWNIRRCGQRRYPQLCDSIAVVPTPEDTAGPDRVLWRHDHEVFKPTFSAAQTWNYLRTKRNKVPWRYLVWFPQAIPRQSFMVWLAFKNRLSTGVKMRDWGVEQGSERLLGSRITPDWDDTVTSLLQPGRNRLDIVLLRLVFQTSIYVLWKERNSRRHRGACASVDMTTRAIGKLVKNRISSLKYRGNHKLEGLLRRWFEVYPF
ncbi:hypothetical protein F2Q68_00011175 [Brassica cretica]|uniref:Reverse transcriptase zinc-binding domain-containing protein n=1 Tax=Brassica cretica TaxID=69181 RepID=A0A8S9KRK6_BRACR|nr:hypothetical protein F2Q68_00011175 [Brassica cretica]